MIFSITKKNSRIFAFCFFLFFFPQFLASVGLLLEQMFTIVLLLICLVCLYLINARIYLPSVFVGMIMLALLLVSLLRTSDIFSFRDFFELMKPLYFLVFFNFGFVYCKSENKTLSVLPVFIVVVFFLNVFGIFEALTFVGNDIANSLYKDLRGGVQFKAIVSFVSPYTFGAFLFFPLFLNLMLGVSSKYFLARSGFLFLSFLCLITLILTQSRTTLLSLILMVPVFVFLLYKSKWVLGRQKLLSGVMFLSIAILFSLPFIVFFVESNLRYLYSGLSVVYESLLDGGWDTLIYSTPSISNRYEQMLFVWSVQDVLPLIGVGIMKDKVMPESFYAMYLLRGGLVALFLHFYIIYAVVKKSLFCSRFYADKNVVLSSLMFSIALYFLTFPFSYFSSAINDQTRTGFVFYFLVGVVFSTYLRLRRLS